MRALTAPQVETMIIEAMSRDDWATVDALAPRLDELTRPKPSTPIVNAALYYASVGLRIFPLQPGAKIPHKGSSGCHDATTDPATITAWWRRWPQSNVGIATGHLIDVIDIDGPKGVISWAQIDDLPPLLGTVSTPRDGGTHLYIAATGEGNSAGMFTGIDYRGVGGYVVAPPSVNAEGVAYRWRRPLNLTAQQAAA